MQRRTTVTTTRQAQRLLRPADKSVRRKIADFIWDKKNGLCLTRTPENWFAITLYYFFFVLGVLLIFYISMLIAIAVASSNHSRPQYLLDDSPIGSSPSLNFFPQKNARNLLWLSPSKSYSEYVDVIKNEFNNYAEKSSAFNTSQFLECQSPPFGYDDKSPCIFLRMNRIIMWTPKPYKSGDKLPDDVPKDVKALIQNSSTPKIWVSCSGTTAKDRDHITPEFFKFQGEPGFDPSPFPYDRQEDFMDPILALKFNDSNPRKIIYSFTCSAWAKKLDSKHSKVDVTYYFE